MAALSIVLDLQGDDPNLRANVSFDVRVVRVGKANTLLMAPNDWSTLSNGTVDGRPTGLHRYAGEQRFVFGLLNVTDGHGDVGSYDFETKDKDGLYADLSGNLTSIGGSTLSEAPGYFGLGARMSGQGTYPFVNWPDRLNVITTAMTVAFWVRPDVDYVSGGSNWNWSFGRLDTWRLGFYGPGVKFEVTPPTGSAHSTQVVYPLHAGRWYHLAATMKTWSTRTNLSLFVNGALVAWKNESSYQVKSTGTALLYLGRDQANALALFKGIADEFRLYKTALSRDSVRGLLWFLKGANNVVIPRGVFYDSKLYGKLNASSLDQSSPFAGATAYGNSNTLSSNLNSRVIQMVIAKNLTLAQAWGILDLARTQNSSGNITAFPFFATPEFYTLGFSWEVSKLSANTSVVNGGNWTVSPPPPPPSLWQLFWNTVAGLAAYVWNAAVAVGAFFTNVGKWLAQAFISVVKGLTTGDWNDFKNQVLKPLADALRKFIDWFVKLVTDIVSALFGPIINAIKGAMIAFARNVASGLEAARQEWLSRGTTSSVSSGMIASTLFGPYFQLLLVVSIVVVVVLTVSTPFLAIGGFVIGFMISLIIDYLLANAFPARPGAPSAPRPVGLDAASSVFSAIIAFMALLVHSVHGSHTNPEHAFWWPLEARS